MLAPVVTYDAISAASAALGCIENAWTFSRSLMVVS